MTLGTKIFSEKVVGRPQKVASFTSINLRQDLTNGFDIRRPES
jgi:hypothetical protein